MEELCQTHRPHVDVIVIHRPDINVHNEIVAQCNQIGVQCIWRCEMANQNLPDEYEAENQTFPDAQPAVKRLLAAGFRLRTAASEPELPEPMDTDAGYALKDRLGTWKARWGVNRMKYTVPPGLYRLGKPAETSPVLVTANYKMSFDMLRRELTGRDAWILVLDTKGINVWCAAGKGTFGTEELVRRIKRTGLSSFVTHRRLILPQLGAPGVSAQEVRRQSGFAVSYGPVRASDLPAYLDAGEQATPAMRAVRFPMAERMALIPIELRSTLQPLLLALGVLFLLNATGMTRFGRHEASLLLAGILSGAVLVPALLPWVPGRAFSFKGLCLGAVVAAGLLWMEGFNPLTAGLFTSASGTGWVPAAASLMVVMSIASYLAMNFTGCSTYTSPSGVRKEMGWAVPMQAILVVLGGLGVLLNGGKPW
jgi:hypothetical protein